MILKLLGRLPLAEIYKLTNNFGLQSFWRLAIDVSPSVSVEQNLNFLIFTHPTNNTVTIFKISFVSDFFTSKIMLRTHAHIDNKDIIVKLFIAFYGTSSSGRCSFLEFRHSPRPESLAQNNTWYHLSWNSIAVILPYTDALIECFSGQTDWISDKILDKLFTSLWQIFWRPEPR